MPVDSVDQPRIPLLMQGTDDRPVDVPAEDYRLNYGALVTSGITDLAHRRGGVLPGVTSGKATITANRIAIEPFQAWIPGNSVLHQGGYTVTSLTESVFEPASPAGNALYRKGRVVAHVYDGLYDEGEDWQWAVELWEGPDAATAADATLPALPETSISLLDYQIGVGGAIVVLAGPKYTVANGGVVPMDAELRQPPIEPGSHHGQMAITTDGTLWAWDNKTTPAHWKQAGGAGGGMTVRYDVQAFTAAGPFTWNKPVGALRVSVAMFGAGGGGASGGLSGGPYRADGGYGGDGGSWLRTEIAASDLPAQVTGVIGAGGAGGGAVVTTEGTSLNANPSPGNAGGATTFSALTVLGGAGGSWSASTAWPNPMPTQRAAAGPGGAGGAPSLTNDAGNGWAPPANGRQADGNVGGVTGTAGGGGGGGLWPDASPIGRAGGAGGAAPGTTDGPAGGRGMNSAGEMLAAAGTSAGPQPAGVLAGDGGGGGGGGGAYSRADWCSGKPGGNGGVGAGGGGGGAAYGNSGAAGVTTGKGGNGGNGLVFLVTECAVTSDGAASPTAAEAIPVAQKNAAGGVAGLDQDARVPVAQLPVAAVPITAYRSGAAGSLPFGSAQEIPDPSLLLQVTPGRYLVDVGIFLVNPTSSWHRGRLGGTAVHTAHSRIGSATGAGASTPFPAGAVKTMTDLRIGLSDAGGATGLATITGLLEIETAGSVQVLLRSESGTANCQPGSWLTLTKVS